MNWIYFVVCCCLFFPVVVHLATLLRKVQYGLAQLAQWPPQPHPTPPPNSCTLNQETPFGNLLLCEQSLTAALTTSQTRATLSLVSGLWGCASHQRPSLPSLNNLHSCCDITETPRPRTQVAKLTAAAVRHAHQHKPCLPKKVRDLSYSIVGLWLGGLE